MWGNVWRCTLLGAALTLGAASCAGLMPSVPSAPRPSVATPGEQMPGPASVWLTSQPAAPASAVGVTMTAPDEPSIRFGHTFAAGKPLRGLFSTSEGRYELAALGGACRLSLALGTDVAVDVVLTIGPGAGCSLAVVRRGRMGDPAMARPDDAVLITNGDVGTETPFIEPVSSPDGP